MSNFIVNVNKYLTTKKIKKAYESKISDVIDFIGYLKMKNDREMFQDLEKASESSLTFWDNDIDDEAWDNV